MDIKELHSKCSVVEIEQNCGICCSAEYNTAVSAKLKLSL
jgi:hypothetical protein